MASIPPPPSSTAPSQLPPTNGNGTGLPPAPLPPSQPSSQRLPPPPPSAPSGHVPGTVPSHAPGWNDLPHSEILSRNSSTANAIEDVAQDQLHAKLEAILAVKRDSGSIPDRAFKDCEKRMSEILGKLREHKVALPLATHLSVLVEAFNAGNNDEVSRELQALSTTFVDEAKWIVGLRRLLQLRD